MTYDVYPSDDVMLDALEAGNKSNWDLVVMSTVPVLARALPEHLVEPVETDRISNYGNIEPDILAKTAPGIRVTR